MAARTLMFDIKMDPIKIGDIDEKFKVIETIESVLKPMGLQKKNEHLVGNIHLITYSNDDGSSTCFLKTHPFGLITLSLDEYSSEPDYDIVVAANKMVLRDFHLSSDPIEYRPIKKVDDIKELLETTLNRQVHKVPVVKRGAAVPCYYSTSDERVLEYDFNKIVFEGNSPFQNIKILSSPTLGNTLILDDLQNLSEADISYTHGLMKKGQISYADKEILILGGGDGGLLHELRKEKPKFVTMVDIDQMVIDACKKHLRGACGDSLDKLEGDNYHVIVDDCVKMMEIFLKEKKTFDIIFNDLTDIPISSTTETTYGEQWDFVKRIVTLAFSLLRPDGRYLNHAIGVNSTDALEKYEKLLKGLPEKVEFKSHSAYVPSFMEDWVFYEVWRFH